MELAIKRKYLDKWIFLSDKEKHRVAGIMVVGLSAVVIMTTPMSGVTSLYSLDKVSVWHGDNRSIISEVDSINIREVSEEISVEKRIGVPDESEKVRTIRQNLFRQLADVKQNAVVAIGTSIMNPTIDTSLASDITVLNRTNLPLNGQTESNSDLQSTPLAETNSDSQWNAEMNANLPISVNAEEDANLPISVNTEEDAALPTDMCMDIAGFSVNSKGYITGMTAPVTEGLLIFPSDVACCGVMSDAFAMTETEDIMEVYIPANITDIEDGALANLYNLIHIDVSDANPVYYSEDGVLYKKDGGLVCIPEGRRGLQRKY